MPWKKNILIVLRNTNCLEEIALTTKTIFCPQFSDVIFSVSIYALDNIERLFKFKLIEIITLL